ncbi:MULTISPECIES: hypothetical protein [Acinetobacter]|uniref:primase 1D-like protein n=1 Tax=Acinetobacter TaxID=469 RepID=UPI0015D25105|nr:MULTISPECIES: hypothetical protein [Acinetobacter]
MISKDHPFYLIQSVLDNESTYSLSKYIYLPDSLSDEREFVHPNGTEFTEIYISNLINSLNSNQELAFHSNIKTKYGKTYHVPMIDFTIKNEITREAFYRLNNFIDKKIFQEMTFFSSGHSFHAYSRKLLTHKEWLSFMGSLLLVNPVNAENSIIDTRWIGHRIMSGYGSLRWSNNSGKYLQLPKRFEIKL